MSAEMFYGLGNPVSSRGRVFSGSAVLDIEYRTPCVLFLGRRRVIDEDFETELAYLTYTNTLESACTSLQLCAFIYPRDVHSQSSRLLIHRSAYSYVCSNVEVETELQRIRFGFEYAGISRLYLHPTVMRPQLAKFLGRAKLVSCRRVVHSLSQR